jgi:hypothetical protein
LGKEIDFINQIAPLVKECAKTYGIKVFSPVIAQACLESAYGTSELALQAHNYFGLKYRQGRCKTAIGIYQKNGSEQNSDGSYVTSSMQWCKFLDMKGCVIGYFDFIDTPRYSNLKGITDPKKYLETIKADGYATSIKYVDNLMRVINQWNLMEYDNKEEKKDMSNSSLVSYTRLSPNHSGQRTHTIDRITPHCVVGQCSVETLGNIFAPSSRQASCNYGIGADGRVGLYVEECNRSWCSSSNANDQRAVTIECASDTTSPYAFKPVVYDKLIDLCVDICKRNGKNKLLWLGDKNTTLNYSPKSNEMVLTVHRWFANKACPGDWLMARMNDLASKVTARLGGASTTPSAPAPSTGSNTSFPATPFSVQVLVSDLNIRREPKMGNNVVGQTGKGVFTITAVTDGWGKLKSGAGYIYLENREYVAIKGSVASSPAPKADNSFKVKVTASALNVRKGVGTGYGISTVIRKNEVYTIVATQGNWGKLKSGAGWICLDYTQRV